MYTHVYISKIVPDPLEDVAVVDLPVKVGTVYQRNNADQPIGVSSFRNAEGNARNNQKKVHSTVYSTL